MGNRVAGDLRGAEPNVVDIGCGALKVLKMKGFERMLGDFWKKSEIRLARWGFICIFAAPRGDLQG